MKKLSIRLFTIVFAIVSLSAQPYKLKEIWTSNKTLKIPESVLYDAKRELFYISNINGSPLEKNNQGFISTMKLGGKIDKMDWITGLHAPKGMAVYESKLFVSDIDRVAEININSGRVSEFHDITGAKFLNDVTIDSERSVYISDSDAQNSVIYRLKDSTMEEWLRSDQIVSPNGLYAEKDRLMIGSFSNNGLFAVYYSDKRIERIADVGMSIDGVVPDGKGNYFVSDWQGRVALVTAAGNVTVLSDTRQANINAADIEYVIARQILLIPTFSDNRVVVYKVE
jgi:sugar lactone lactonase YvrE